MIQMYFIFATVQKTQTPNNLASVINLVQKPKWTILVVVGESEAQSKRLSNLYIYILRSSLEEGPDNAS